ncbi:MAG: hypothetical protein ACYDH3_00035 [Candidatus Aminicenantales bacterium]
MANPTVIAIITGAFGLIPSIFKHKPNCVWRWDGQKWEMVGGPFSARQCRKQIATLVSVGHDPKTFIILRKGITPPPVFQPKKGEK